MYITDIRIHTILHIYLSYICKAKRKYLDMYMYLQFTYAYYIWGCKVSGWPWGWRASPVRVFFCTMCVTTYWCRPYRKTSCWSSCPSWLWLRDAHSIRYVQVAWSLNCWTIWMFYIKCCLLLYLRHAYNHPGFLDFWGLWPLRADKKT